MRRPLPARPRSVSDLAASPSRSLPHRWRRTIERAVVSVRQSYDKPRGNWRKARTLADKNRPIKRRRSKENGLFPAFRRQSTFRPLISTNCNYSAILNVAQFLAALVFSRGHHLWALSKRNRFTAHVAIEAGSVKGDDQRDRRFTCGLHRYPRIPGNENNRSRVRITHDRTNTDVCVSGNDIKYLVFVQMPVIRNSGSGRQRFRPKPKIRRAAVLSIDLYGKRRVFVELLLGRRR
jgi:hypothetical protein